MGIIYQLGDLTGRYGVEKAWESDLRGKDGANFVEVDVHGHRISYVGEKSSVLYGFKEEERPEPGKNIILTIDKDLQEAAFEALGDHLGAVVMLDPRSGEVLSMVSKPSFNPSAISLRDSKFWRELRSNEFGRLRNKAIQDHHPPGSTFKPFLLLAGLEEGVINPETKIYCGPSFRLGRRTYYDHTKFGYGNIDMVTALQKSSNVFMWNVANQMDVDDITKVAKSFGFGNRTNIGLANETPGFMPTQEWATNVRKAPWQRGETLSIAIGQGATLVSPLQLANAYGALATGGLLYKPYIVSRIEDATGKILKEYRPELLRKRKIDPIHLHYIKQGLSDAVNERGGTGIRLRTEKKIFSGKTGTAQVMSRKSKEDLFANCKQKPYKQRHHGWFVAYGPREHTEIVISVLVLHGCTSSVAVQVAKKALNRWQELKEEREKKQGPLPKTAALKVR